MTARDDRAEVLARIRTALGTDRAQADATPETPIRGSETVDVLTLARRFAHELALVGGEARFVASEDALPAAIASYAAERGLGPPTDDFATTGYALLRAEALLADTGSALVVERNASRRLAPYLPRTSIIVCDAQRIYPRMTEEAMAAAYDAARSGDPGEALLITGPSRTADIEKTLVLGAHGPRDVAVFIVGVAER